MPNRISSFTLERRERQIVRLRVCSRKQFARARALAVQSQPSDSACSPFKRIIFVLLICSGAQPKKRALY